VSGFADIFFVAFSLIFGIFITPLMLEAALLKHMGPCVTLKKKVKSDIATTDSKKRISNVLIEVKDRFKLKLSIWVIIASKLLPERWRSSKTSKLFELVRKSQSRIE
jgi:hypothetical protein